MPFPGISHFTGSNLGHFRGIVGDTGSSFLGNLLKSQRTDGVLVKLRCLFVGVIYDG